MGGGAADALASLGEQGIERLIAIIMDPATTSHTREAAGSILLFSTLARVSDKSSRAADMLLAAAADSADLRVQVRAVWALRSMKTRVDDVRTALESAFSTGNAEARRAVVYVWEETGLPPGDLIERVFADPVPDVRAAVFKLLPRLPTDDPRRVTLAQAALQDENERVRDKGLEFAGQLGAAGAALLAQYAARGEPLTHSFFNGVKRLGTLNAALVAALEARTVSASADVRVALRRSSGALAPKRWWIGSACTLSWRSLMSCP